MPLRWQIVRHTLASIVFAAALLGISGCAGFGIVATSDPAAKLIDAGDLFDRQDRPLPAERLIREALEIYQKQDNQLGVAEAYRTYGFFFRSPSVEGKWSKYYRQNGFLDKSATFATRYAKSVEYFEKARAIFAEHKRFDALTNVDLNMGFTYVAMGNTRAACQAFDRSFENYRDNLRQTPGARPVVPKGFVSYEEFLADRKERYGCAIEPGASRATLAPVYGPEAGQSLVLDAAVQERAKSLLEHYKPRHKALRLSELHEINNVGNFGKLVYFDHQSHYSQLQSGLWAMVGHGAFTSGSAAGTSQSLSLCGIITLLAVSDSLTKLELTAPIPFGRMFLPFGMRSSIDIGRRVRVKDLRTEYKELCTPVAGSKFSYQIENEVQIKTSGIFGRTVVTSTVIDVSCQVAKVASPANRLSNSFSGESLRVSCESNAKPGQKRMMDYAFLKELGLYLILNDSSSAQKTKVQYKAIDYRE